MSYTFYLLTSLKKGSFSSETQKNKGFSWELQDLPPAKGIAIQLNLKKKKIL